MPPREPIRIVALPTPAAPMSPAEAEVGRVMQICNGCRYCEGFCAVFPAMTRRLEFGRADVHFLANLCHQCGACLHACQYAPPHEFAINVPQAMATVRGQTYADYAWPPALGRLYRRNGLTLGLALVVSLCVFLMLALVLVPPLAAGSTGSPHSTVSAWEPLWRALPRGDFLAVFPHGLLVGLFAPMFALVVLALGLGVRRFWREVTPATSGHPLNRAAAAEATGQVLRLTYLGGGHGEGCHEVDEGWSLARRRLHHFTFYGFMLCFAATAAATLLHYLGGQVAPYDLPSLPKLLGAAGGVSLLIGTSGLWWLGRRRHPSLVAPAQRPMDRAFVALLWLTSASGLALWAARGAPVQTLLLCVHLGAVLALFATLPYGKFAHGVYRTAALLRHAVELRQPNTLGLADD